ncbi:odorant receptor 85b-like [Drosophila pseudoobscura]|uniref:Odorant receptor n=1 Tax=Drosophila pseudoobscura pseudoobscura TaxID=46245 RepID=A0A6I8WCH9_DROPS|nr:odorant receptor 85b [Drosophila pseudoobscura]
MTYLCSEMDKFMKYANFFYTTVGFEAYATASRPPKDSLRNRIVFWGNLVNLAIVGSGEAIYFYLAIRAGNLLEAVTVMSYIGFIIVGVSKIFFIMWKKPALSAMVQELEDLFPRGKVQEAQFHLEDYLRSCSRISFNYGLLYFVLIWTFNLYPIMELIVFEKWLKIRIVGKTLPYLMYAPWKWDDNWSYYPLLVAQNLGGYTSAAGQISTDLLLCSVATQVVMHFDHLARSMENHNLSGDWPEDSRFISEVVRYHERILRLSDVVNDILGVPLLLNFMVSSFVICFVGFQMTVGVSPDMITKLFLYLVSSMSQVYLICHYGQMVADASFGLSVAVYNQNWSHADVRYQRALLLIIARAQKTTHLKATIFLDITRSTMTDLLQISYKFFALLRTMYVQ